MKRLSWAVLAALVFILAACGREEAAIERQLQQMTLREKVGQLFMIRPESLDSALCYRPTAELQQIGLKEVNPLMKATAEAYPVGGIILFAHNMADQEQLEGFVKDLKALNGAPLLAIDEEGGRVARIGNNPAFGVPKFPPMGEVAEGGQKAVKAAAFSIGTYLKEYGFDIDLAPVADVNTNPENIIIGPRAFSDDPETAGKMVQIYLKALQKQGVSGCLKHFPGHGDTKADTHLGYAVSHKTREDLLNCEMIPFKAGIKAGARMIMSAHVSLPNVTGTETPSTLSPDILQGILRKDLGYDGVIITDALEMGAITSAYSIDEACILAIEAGADLLLCVRNYRRCVDAIVAAVESGRLSESRLDESLRRINKLR
jgi:beta-N-acetylhexosaminidase